MKKILAEIEIPKGTSDTIYRQSLAEITKTIQTARLLRKERITVTVEQGD